MTAKEYLQQAYRIDSQINSKLEQVKTLHDLATKANATLSLTPPSGSRNVHSMEDAITKMADMKNEISVALNRMLELKQEISATINEVASVEQRMLLELRYICCKTWEDIAAEMSYSMRSVYNIHGVALGAVTKVMEKK